MNYSRRYTKTYLNSTISLEEFQLSGTSFERSRDVYGYRTNSTDSPVVKEFESLVRTAATLDSNELVFENATAYPDYAKRVRAAFLDLFAKAKSVSFEDGVETTFSRNIIALVKKFQHEAIDVLNELIIEKSTDSRLTAEALTWLGQINDSISHDKRRELLESQLQHSSAYIRDGAAVGLAYLDDPRSLNALEQALESERVASIREYIEETIEQLQETVAEKNNRAFSPKKN